MIIIDNSIALPVKYGVIQIVKSIVRLVGYMVIPFVLSFATLAKCGVTALISHIVTNVVFMGMIR